MAAAEHRLRRSADIARAVRQGRRARQRLVHAVALPNGLPYSRFALSVGKRVGSAVVRNRVKRRLRPLLWDRPTRGGYDIVVTAHAGSESASFAELKSDTERCLFKIGVLMPEDA